MGFLGDLLSSKNRFNAEAKRNSFQAQQANLTPQEYDELIKKSQSGLMDTGADANQQQSRGQEQDFISALRDQAAGKGPSLAQGQLQSASEEASKKAAGAIAGGRGIDPALQMRMIADQNAAAQQGLAKDSAQLRMQEQLGTQGMLANALQRARSQDLASQAQAQGTSVAALQTAGGLEGGQQGRTLQNFQQTQGMNADVARGNQQAELDAQHINADVAAGNQRASNAMTGALVGGAASMLSLSDERVKADVHRLDSEALPGVPEAVFRYLNEPEGTTHRGVIAQDVEEKYPELVSRDAHGMRRVPAGLMKYADGGRVGAGLRTFANALQEPDDNPYAESFNALGAAIGKKLFADPYAAGAADLAESRARNVDNAAMSSGYAHGGLAVDDERRDTVPALLSEGEIVLPRSVALYPDAPERAKEFVAAIKKGKKPAKMTKGGEVEGGYGLVLARLKNIQERIARLEAEG